VAQFVNIHTHNFNDTGLSIINLFPEDIKKVKENKFYSAGIHPWKVGNTDIYKQLQQIDRISKQENILAVGETGLDKLRPEFSLQKDVFLKQIKIAETVRKPIIVHCVKAYSELTEIIKKENIQVPVIIHRYSGNITIARQLIKFGCYFSFGHELCNTKSKTPGIFNRIPVENIFLETDDAETNIKDIYKTAAEIKSVDTKHLAVIVMKNFKKVFKK